MGPKHSETESSPNRKALKKIRFAQEQEEPSNNQATESEYGAVEGALSTLGNILTGAAFVKELLTFIRKPEIREFIVNKVMVEFLDNPINLKGENSMKSASRKIVGDNQLDVPQPLNLMGKTSSLGKTPAKSPVDGMTHFKFQKLAPTKSSHKEMKPIGGTRRHVNGYLPIAIYLAYQLGMTEDHAKLVKAYFEYFNEEVKEMVVDEKNPMMSQDFVIHLLTQLMVYHETKIYHVYLSNHSDLSELIEQDIFEVYNENNRVDMLLNYFEALHQQLKSQSAASVKVKRNLSTEAKAAEKVSDTPRSAQQSKCVVLAKFYFECTQENHLLITIFNQLNLTKRQQVEIILNTKEVARILKFFQEFDNYFELLTAEDIINHRLFPVLALFDKKYLIDIFNMTVEGNTTVFKALCQMIEAGSDEVEDLCNVVISVNETFWDLPKFTKIFKAFEKLIRKKPTEGETNWLTYVENPLLFFITLIFYFNQMKKQLDFNIPEVSELVKDMLNFSISYITNISDENLKMNMFEKDSNGREFLEYVMFVEEMKILEIEQIENLLEFMWDINRSSMQTLDIFMRVGSMMEKIKKVNFGMYTLDYEVPIEDGDEFNLEFQFASNSVKMRVLPEMGWPVTLFFVDFIFSMYLCQMRLNNTWDSNWFNVMYNNNSAFMIIFLYLRFSHILSVGMKVLALKSNDRGGEDLLFIFRATLFLYFLQMVIYPSCLWDYFWILNNLQMLIVLANVGYIIYSALSLSEAGVVIRIFFRMALVVLVFGVVSWVVMLFIAYPIHVVYMNFDQPIEGQWYANLNLFDDLYQGVLTLFEFVFGAVVLVRAYILQDANTYTMTFIMTMFSFFGNIMIANMLVAFLTSQFDLISQKAKFLTMQTQYELIQVYNMKDMDSIFSLPYFLAPLALIPFGMMASMSGPARKRLNVFLRKVNHIFNCYLPMLILMNLNNLMQACIRYVEMSLRIVSECIKNPFKLLIHLISWMVAGPFLLIKLLVLDNVTIAKVMLQFSKEGGELLNFELDDVARANLVTIFSRISRIANRDKSREYLDIKSFLDEMGVISLVDSLGEKAMNGDNDPKLAVATGLFAALSAHVEPPQAQQTRLDNETTVPPVEEKDKDDDDKASNAFNSKYKQSEDVLAHDFLMKYTTKHPDTGKLVVDLKFMRDKFKTITQENVPYLISFDKKSLMAASIHMLEEVETDLGRQMIHVSKEINKHYDRVGHVLQDLKAVKEKYIS